MPLVSLIEFLKRLPNSLFDQLHTYERQLDWLIVDASGASSAWVQNFASAANDLLIVTTPEPTAVAEAYASVKSLAMTGTRLGTLINQADGVEQAQQILGRLQQVADSFLQVDLHRRGFIPRDVAVPKSVADRVPFVMQSPESPAATAVRQLAQRWTRPKQFSGNAGFFFRFCEMQYKGSSITRTET